VNQTAAIKHLKLSAVVMQAAVFEQMYLLWAAEVVLAGGQCSGSFCCNSKTCDPRTYAEFRSRKSTTSAEILKQLGNHLSASAARVMVQNREGVKRSMQWLQRLGAVLNRFQSLVSQGLAVCVGRARLLLPSLLLDSPCAPCMWML